MAIATFAAGCFWGVEEAFRHLDGVSNTTVGYTGGHIENPTYDQVCSDQTGHAEAVQVEYEPSKISYEALLAIFWQCHDPTTSNRQGADIGSQYRSAIFFHTAEQETAANRSKQELQRSGHYEGDVVTEIVPAGEFYPAEEHHQCYLAKHGMGTRNDNS